MPPEVLASTREPWVAESRAELVAGATDRVPVRTTDAKSGARFERLTLGGVPHFLKTLSAADDWIMRVTGNTSNWEFRVWQAGIYAACPPVIDHTIVGMALEGTGPTAVLSILMIDCGTDLVPPGDAPVPLGHHRDFLDHMARLHARLPRLAGRPRTAGSGAAVPVLRAGEHRDRAAGLRRAAADRGRGPRLAAAAGTSAAAARPRPLGPSRSRGAGDRPADDAADLRARRLEVRQPRPPPRRPHRPARLGLPRRGGAVLGPHLVPRAQCRPAAGVQGAGDRLLPRPAGAPRGRDQRVVGEAAGSEPARA